MLGRWTEEQHRHLIHQVTVEKKGLADIVVSGKTQAAINNKWRRLRMQGVIADRPTRRVKPWNIQEIKQLRILTIDYGFSAVFISTLRLIPDRSKYSLGKMMGRQGLGNPEAKQLAKNAARLGPEDKERLIALLKSDQGMKMPSKQIASEFGLAAKTINAWRRRLGIQISWQQARDSDAYRQRQQEVTVAFVKKTKERWEKYRQEKIKSFQRALNHLASLKNPPQQKSCAKCGSVLYKDPCFFYVQRRTRQGRKVEHLTNVCKLCRSEQRRKRGQSRRAK